VRLAGEVIGYVTPPSVLNANLGRCFVGAVSSERGVSAPRPAEGLSGPSSGGAARGPPQSQYHQRGASPGLLPGLQRSPWRPLPPQPVQHAQQALASHW